MRERWRARLYHGYGPAEATIGVSCRVFDPDQATARVSIGRPNPNTQIRVLDAEYNPVPLGVVGELFISGLPLARGYLNDLRRTADQFCPTRSVRNPAAGCTPPGTWAGSAQTERSSFSAGPTTR